MAENTMSDHEPSEANENEPSLKRVYHSAGVVEHGG